MRQIEKQTRTDGENKMGVMPVNRLLVTMALPIMISMIIQAMYNIVDSLFVARISEQALTAVSLAYSVQNLLIGVAVGTGVGVNSLLSRYLGEQNREGVNKTAVNGIFIMLVTYLFFLVFGLFFTRTFFKLQTDSEEIIELGVPVHLPDFFSGRAGAGCAGTDIAGNRKNNLYHDYTGGGSCY